MTADIVGTVYCEFSEFVDDPDGEIVFRSPVTRKRKEIFCPEKTQAIFRYTSYRGNDRLRVVSFVSFTPTGWHAYVDREGSGHAYCSEHAKKIKGGADRRYHVKG